MSALELHFMATGENQHVFSDPADDEWVYKVPAAFGYLLPFDHPRRPVRRPRRPFRRMVHALLAPAPDGGRREAGEDAGEARSPTLRTRVHRTWLRHNRARKFARMLALMDRLRKDGHGALVLPWRVVRGPVRLHVDGRVHPYEGPVLAQRRATFRRIDEIVQGDGWAALVDAQHALWRRGMAVADVVRYTSWAVLDGRVRLADADSLTADPAVARRYVCDAVFAEESALVRRLVEGEAAGWVDAYLAYVRGQVNARVLGRLWGAGAGASRRAA